MLLSFLPVFALGGIEGKMFRPLAFTKTLALASRRRCWRSRWCPPSARSSSAAGSATRRTVGSSAASIDVYRPVLAYLLDRPAAGRLVLGVDVPGRLRRRSASAVLFSASLVAAALVAVGLTATLDLPVARRGAWSAWSCSPWSPTQSIEPLGREFLTPLDEGMVMDMPITVPRVSIAQAADDLKARDMVLCRFPEVRHGRSARPGRAETPTDPAPLDMIETMVEFRPREFPAAADVRRPTHAPRGRGRSTP